MKKYTYYLKTSPKTIITLHAANSEAALKKLEIITHGNTHLWKLKVNLTTHN